MRSLSRVVSECSLSGRGQGHVCNFYIVDLKKFRHSKSSVYRWYPQLVRGQFVYDTHRTMEVTRSRHGWVHMFITHLPTVTLQLHSFDLFRTCCTSTFCAVTWQLSRFQLTWRIARSLSDSWASFSNRDISYATDSMQSHSRIGFALKLQSEGDLRPWECTARRHTCKIYDFVLCRLAVCIVMLVQCVCV